MSGKKKIIYRRMTAEDIPWFLPVLKEYFSSVEEEFTEDVASNWLSWFLQTIRNPASLAVGGFSGKKVAAFACVSPMPSLDGKPMAFIEQFYVQQGFRNEGVGLTLWKVVDGWMKQAGFQKVLTAETVKDQWISKKKRLLGFTPYRNLLIKTM